MKDFLAAFLGVLDVSSPRKANNGRPNFYLSMPANWQTLLYMSVPFQKNGVVLT